jgi:hypothetical protein
MLTATPRNTDAMVRRGRYLGALAAVQSDRRILLISQNPPRTSECEGGPVRFLARCDFDSSQSASDGWRRSLDPGAMAFGLRTVHGRGAIRVEVEIDAMNAWEEE